MDYDRTWPTLVRFSLVISLSLIGFVLLDKAGSALRAQSIGKSQGTSLSREEVASLLQEAALLLQTGKLDDAEPLVRRALAAAPSNADAHNLLGVILDQRGNLAQAE